MNFTRATCVKGKALPVLMLFRNCKDDSRRIYVSEHLTLHDSSSIFREANRMKNEPVFESFHQKGRCFVEW
jgi:hypothetical protein